MTLLSVHLLLGVLCGYLAYVVFSKWLRVPNRYLFLGLLCLGTLLFAGCTATWLSALGAAIPSIETLATAILTFVAALSGKTISAADAAAISKGGTDATTELGVVQTLISDEEASPSTTLVGKIQAVLQGIVANLGTIFSGVSITDADTKSKFTELTDLFISAVQAALALIPLVAAKALALEPLDQDTVRVLIGKQDDFKIRYHNFRHTLTGNPLVDAAVAQLPKSL